MSKFFSCSDSAIRSPEQPYGKPDVSDRAREKLEMGNLFASWLLSLMTLSLCLDLVFWVENPDLSWMFRLPSWKEFLAKQQHHTGLQDFLSRRAFAPDLEGAL